jgi:arylsulfatase A-like enzyme
VDGVPIGVLTGGRVEGRAAKVERRHLYWEFQGKQALRLGRWKGIRDGREDTFELYDLAVDPREERNVALSQTGVVAELKDLMSRSRTESARYPLVRAK